MFIPDWLVSQIKNDVDWVKPQPAYFDGMAVKQHLDMLMLCDPTNAIKEKITEALRMYKHDGHQCFSDSDRPRLTQLLREIVTEINQ